MTPRSLVVLFYISGHGYGHATRSRAVIDALLQSQPSLNVHVRTVAPSFLFRPLPTQPLYYWPVQIDSPVYESPYALSIDADRTVAALRSYLNDLPELVESEARFARETGAGVIAADIPFVAGLIAKQAGIPAVAFGNFTWDWIFESLPGAQAFLGRIKDAYAMFSRALRLPMSHRDGWQMFPDVIDIPLVAPRSMRARGEIRAELGIADDPRTIVLVAGRDAPPPPSNLDDPASQYVFFGRDALPCFQDLVRASDIIVSKLGYSIAAECIAERAGILFPPRTGFREHEILVRETGRYTKSLGFPYEDWESGNWLYYLDRLRGMPHPSGEINIDGAAVVAGQILEFAGYS